MTAQIHVHLGKLIRKIRESLGMSQSGMAKSLGDTRDRVAKIELALQKPDVGFLGELRERHNVSLDELFDEARKS